MSAIAKDMGLASAIVYRDPDAALRFLATAFGFQPVFVVRDPEGRLLHSESIPKCGSDRRSSWWATNGARSTAARPVWADATPRRFTSSWRMEPTSMRTVRKPALRVPRSWKSQQTSSTAIECIVPVIPRAMCGPSEVTVRAMTPAEWDAAGGVVTQVAS